MHNRVNESVNQTLMEDAKDGDTPEPVQRFAVPFALFLFAFLVRVLPYNNVFHPTGLQFFGSDAYYHMRRIVYSLTNFPSVLEFDRYISFPEGARPIWSPIFDWSIAALLMPLREFLSIEELERVVVWIPPILGSLTVIILYHLARNFFGWGTATLAGLFLAVLSAHFWYSQIGFVDHHAAVAPVVTLLLAVGMEFFRRSSDLAEGAGRARGISIALGVMLALALLVWPGTLLHVGLLETALLVYLLTRTERDQAAAVAWEMTTAHATATLLLAPFALGNVWTHWSLFSPVVLSNFQPWYFAAATLFSLACAWSWSDHRRSGRTRTRRCASALAIGGAIVLASLALWPSVLIGVDEIWQWFAREEPFQKLVGESTPLFILDGRFTTRIALARLSGFVFLAPIALIATVVMARRRADWAAIAFFLWWTAGLLAATLVQKRFFNSSSVPLALLFAISTSWAYRTLPNIRIFASGRPMFVKALVACAAVGLVIPTLTPYPLYLTNIYKTLLADGMLEVRPDTSRHLETVHLARWIRDSTPETSGWDDVNQIPEYGILAPWGIGHVLEYIGRRPTVTNNFGDDIGREQFLLAQEYYRVDESRALEIADRLNVKYVVATSNLGFLAQRPASDSILAALHQFDGSEYKVARNGSRDWIPAMMQHRLIYEWMPNASRAKDQFRFKVFEIVPGARLVGRAAPGAEISLALSLETTQKRKFSYAARTTASEDGLYTLRVPYSNSTLQHESQVTSTARPGYRYELGCNGERSFVRVSEEAVLNGKDVLAPSMCLSEGVQQRGATPQDTGVQPDARSHGTQLPARHESVYSSARRRILPSGQTWIRWARWSWPRSFETGA